MMTAVETNTSTSTLPNPLSAGPCCRFCAEPLRHTFVDLGTSPLCQKHVTPAQFDHGEPFYPLHVYVCEKCYLVQLPAYVSREAIFDGEYAYFSSYSETMLAHARAYVEQMTARFGLGGRSRVVELASNDGYLLQYFLEKKIPCLGIEPTANTAAAAQEKGVPTIVRFFGRQTAREVLDSNGPADLILGNNVLAHVPDINDFVGGMKILLSPAGVVTMEFPQLLHLIDKKTTGIRCITNTTRTSHSPPSRRSLRRTGWNCSMSMRSTSTAGRSACMPITRTTGHILSASACTQ